MRPSGGGSGGQHAPERRRLRAARLQQAVATYHHLLLLLLLCCCVPGPAAHTFTAAIHALMRRRRRRMFPVQACPDLAPPSCSFLSVFFCRSMERELLQVRGTNVFLFCCMAQLQRGGCQQLGVECRVGTVRADPPSHDTCCILRQLLQQRREPAFCFRQRVLSLAALRLA